MFDGIPSKLKMKTIEARTRRRDNAYNAWLEPAETMEFGAGEKLDRYTLLCSLIIALGNP